MDPIDWLIVLGLNGAVILYGFHLARGTKTSREWFLGSRALPWWAIGLSMFATNMDNSDLVSVTGYTYQWGLAILTVHTLGSALGGLLVAFFVVPTFYRAGLYTNAEYLEGRFGPSMRLLSALIQIQYRTTVLGLMIWALFLLLTNLVQMTPVAAWTLIVLLVVLSASYTAWGGLRTVVITDALQSIILLIAVFVLFSVVSRAAGGWSGTLQTLAELSTEAEPVAGQIRPVDGPHIGRFHGKDGQTSPYVVVLGWIIVACGYWTVNHTQTMRLMGARSLWDARMAALLGVALSMPIAYACCALGVFGRALFPEFESADEMFPHLAATYLGPGLKGLVVAGILAAGLSTFDSMGSALSAVFTRDIYARLIAPDRDDEHYVKVGRYATVAILSLGFVYIPFIRSKATMLEAFRTLIPVFVTPLFTTYLIGIWTRFPRRAGIGGLALGGIYGIVAFYDRETQDLVWLPNWLTGSAEAFSWSIVFTLLGATAVTLLGADRKSGRRTGAAGSPANRGWLARSSEELPPFREHPFRRAPPVWLHPAGFAAALILASAYIIFVVFW